jgi:hypothetical protein
MTGSGGQQGNTGPAGPTTRWADPSDVVVPGVLGPVSGPAGASLTYLDVSANYWTLPDPDVAAIAPVNVDFAVRSWTSTNCAGTVYYARDVIGPFVPPRVTFTLLGSAQAYVRLDAAHAIELNVSSTSLVGGACTQVTPHNVTGVKEADVVQAAIASVAFTPPLHPVYQ